MDPAREPSAEPGELSSALFHSSTGFYGDEDMLQYLTFADSEIPLRDKDSI
jgi:hypothetical protein